MTTKQHYDWLNYIEKIIIEQDGIPLLGNTPSFPLGEFAIKLRQRFHIEELQVNAEAIRWRSIDELWSGLGEDISYVNFIISPIEGKLTLAIAAEDLNRVSAWMLSKQQKPIHLDQPSLREGLSKFLAAECFSLIDSLGFLEELSPRLCSDNRRISEPSLGMDITLQAYDQTASCRLIISPAFRQAWVQHFKQKPAVFSEELKDGLEIITHLEVGKIDLTLAQWADVTEGDFVPLDTHFYDPILKKGRPVLTVGGKPIMRAQVKPGAVKLVEYPFYYEEENVMENNENNEEGFSEEEELKDELFEDISEEEKENDEQQEGEGLIQDLAVEEDRQLISPDEISLTISVEVKRIRMSARKLLELRPGNLLELDVHPDSPISLVTNGKSIARGELIRVGEVLGVRILEIG